MSANAKDLVYELPVYVVSVVAQGMLGYTTTVLIARQSPRCLGSLNFMPFLMIAKSP